MLLAYLLIIIGIVFLLKNLGIIPGSAWGIIWPLFLIALGLSIIFGRHRHWWSWWWPGPGPRRGPSSKETEA